MLLLHIIMQGEAAQCLIGPLLEAISTLGWLVKTQLYTKVTANHINIFYSKNNPLFNLPLAKFSNLGGCGHYSKVTQHGGKCDIDATVKRDSSLN